MNTQKDEKKKETAVSFSNYTTALDVPYAICLIYIIMSLNLLTLSPMMKGHSYFINEYVFFL